MIAQVLRTPAVTARSNNIIYQTTTTELRINGEGLIGARGPVMLYFSPPIPSAAYEDVSLYPLHTNEIILRLKEGKSWREEPGPLFIIGIDTGAGPVKQNGDAGVEIAYVKANDVLSNCTPTWNPTTSPIDTPSGINIEETNQYIYDNSPKLRISGTGFNAEDHDILLELTPEGQQSLVTGKDFLVTKDNEGSGLFLMLLENRR